jgi:cystathionine beta-synthase
LRSHSPGTKVVLADPVGSRLAHFVDQSLPDYDAAFEVEGIGGSAVPKACDLSVIDMVERVTDIESFAMQDHGWSSSGLSSKGSFAQATLLYLAG